MIYVKIEYVKIKIMPNVIYWHFYTGMCGMSINIQSTIDKWLPTMQGKTKRGQTTKMLFYFLSKWHLHIQAAWCTNIRAASDSSIGGSNSFLCCPPHWQGGSLGFIVWVWQLSAPWHLSACCSPRGAYRCRGCTLHICLSEKIELFLSRWNTHHIRKFKRYKNTFRLRLHWMLLDDSLAVLIVGSLGSVLIAITELSWLSSIFPTWKKGIQRTGQRSKPHPALYTNTSKPQC